MRQELRHFERTLAFTRLLVNQTSHTQDALDLICVVGGKQPLIDAFRSRGKCGLLLKMAIVCLRRRRPWRPLQDYCDKMSDMVVQCCQLQLAELRKYILRKRI